MNRSLKTLGVAMIAAFALSALTAPAASAAPKWTPVPSEYPVTMKGSQSTPNVLELEGGRNVTCSSATYEGLLNNKAEAEASKVELNPTYSSCTTVILGNKDLTTITMNECNFLLTYTETTAGTIASEGWEITGKELHIQCPAGHEIEIHVYTSEANDLKNATVCTYTIDPQTPGGDFDYKLTEKDVNKNGTSGDIKWTLTEIGVTRASGTITNCGLIAQHAKLTGEVKIEGFNNLETMLRGEVED